MYLIPAPRAPARPYENAAHPLLSSHKRKFKATGGAVGLRYAFVSTIHSGEVEPAMRVAGRRRAIRFDARA